MMLELIHIFLFLSAITAEPSSSSYANRTNSPTRSTNGTASSTASASINAPDRQSSTDERSAPTQKATPVKSVEERSKTICVKCYDKLTKTPDCKTCELKCDDGTTKSLGKRDGKCPIVPTKELPCPCVGEEGTVEVNNFYKAEDTLKASPNGVLTGSSLSN